VPTDSAATFADGMAVRVPVPEALDIYARGAERIVAVGDEAVAEAIRLLFAATHNAAEGAGAAALAALMAEAGRMAGRKVGVVLSGGNIDSDWLAEVLAGGTPRPR
jgi:threonine dehydratase